MDFISFRHIGIGQVNVVVKFAEIIAVYDYGTYAELHLSSGKSIGVEETAQQVMTAIANVKAENNRILQQSLAPYGPNWGGVRPV
jgi:hypothetical protein